MLNAIIVNQTFAMEAEGTRLKKTGKKEEMALETRELIFKRLHN